MGSGFLLKCFRCCLGKPEVLRFHYDLHGQRMTLGAVLVVANGRHMGSLKVRLMAKPALQSFQSVQCLAYASQYVAVEAEMNLVVEVKRAGVFQPALPP